MRYLTKSFTPIPLCSPKQIRIREKEDEGGKNLIVGPQDFAQFRSLKVINCLGCRSQNSRHNASQMLPAALFYSSSATVKKIKIKKSH